MRSRLVAILAFAALVAGGAMGCGGGDVEAARERLERDVQERVARAREEYERRRERFGRRTIYVSQRFAADLYEGVARGLPGEATGAGRAEGDFAVAYVLAHEYAHNLQQELGIFDNRVTATARPFELQADCLAGTWANSVYAQGELQPGDLEEAANAALAVGDFDVGNAQHHGTPEERRAALLDGFRSGDPPTCLRYVPT